MLITETSTPIALKDIKIMIDHFIDEERYEYCALLVGIKEDVMDYYDKQTEILLNALIPFLESYD